MASGVHSDKRSRVGDSPRFQWECVSRCCAELYVPRPKARLRSGLARKHLSVSRQTSRAPVSAPIDGMLSYVRSGCPKLNRSLRGETRAVRSSGEIPGSPRRSCDGTLWANNKNGKELFAFQPVYAEPDLKLSAWHMTTQTVYRTAGKLIVTADVGETERSRGLPSLKAGTTTLLQAGSSITFPRGF